MKTLVGNRETVKKLGGKFIDSWRDTNGSRRKFGRNYWLQIRKPGFDSRHYQKIKVVGLERGPLSLVSTTQELLDRKVAALV
jgi:hypothetical protein